MPFRLFQYSLPGEQELPELNAFLASHRIATVQREIVVTAAGPMLIFIVEFIAATTAKGDHKPTAAARTDYRELLSDEEYTLYNVLRDIRKKLAEKDGVPVYTIFSNSQLASMVQTRCTSAGNIQKLEGVGKARSEKYSSVFLPELQKAFPEAEQDFQ